LLKFATGLASGLPPTSVVVYGCGVDRFGEDALVVGSQRGPWRSRGESEDVWRQIGELLARGHAQTEARFDRIEGRMDRLELRLDRVDVRLDRFDVRMDHLEADVAEIKTDMGEVKGQLNRLELAYDRRFDRVDAQIEKLIGLIQRDETRS
jgi:chromosome segregation ATPase